VKLQIHDPQADAGDARDLLSVELMDYNDLKPAKAVVVAVPHQAYRESGWGYIEKLMDGEGIVFDVKGILPREEKPDHIQLFRI
jgi:UDP-N-acetyl-D-galactosamine dehydrogenase